MYNFTYLILFLLLLFSCTNKSYQPETEQGCTNEEACNYVASAIEDDGSCQYADENYDCDGNCIAENTDEGCECGQIFGCDNQCGSGLMIDCSGECGGSAVVDLSSDWSIEIISSIIPWDIFDAINDTATLGISSNATDIYDELYDIPEPPSGPSHFISAYFYHPDWEIMLGDTNISTFTQEFKSNQICIEKEWTLYVRANCSGQAHISFNYDNVPGNLTLQFSKGNDEFIVLTEDSVIEVLDLQPNATVQFKIKALFN